jgi:hypothetical protein
MSNPPPTVHVRIGRLCLDSSVLNGQSQADFVLRLSEAISAQLSSGVRGEADQIGVQIADQIAGVLPGSSHSARASGADQ